MVDITFKVIEVIKNDVNEMLVSDNKTKFLKVAFEESLYPCAFLAKKKYYGIPHISQANFAPKELFVRGLEIKKRGVSGVLKKVCGNIMWDSVNMNNAYTLMELVENKIDEIYDTSWDFADFIMTDIFKPNKKNIKVQTFAKRMFAIGVKVKPYERFNYVITQKNPFKYDERGRKKDLSIGEKMEFSERAERLNMPIDLDYYMKGSINGQLSRLITYHGMFHVEPVSDDSDDMKIADDKIYKHSCKYIENYCKQHYKKYNSKGKIYQKIFRMSNKTIIDVAKTIYATETVEILKSNYDTADLLNWLENKASTKAIHDVKNYGINFVEGILDDVADGEKNKRLSELQMTYFANKKDNLSIEHEKMFRIRRDSLRGDVNSNIDDLVAVLQHKSAIVSHVAQYVKTELKIDDMYNGEGDDVPDFDDIAAGVDGNIMVDSAERQVLAMSNNVKLSKSLQKLRYIYVNMISNFFFIAKTRSIIDYLKIKRNKSMNNTTKPKEFNIRQFIKDNVDDMIGGDSII